jgi:hypothetical protein
MLLRLVVVAIVVVVVAQTQPGLDSALERLCKARDPVTGCGPKPGAPPTAIYCAWDSTTQSCGFRSRACPPDLWARIQNVTWCGPTMTCSAACAAAFVQLQALIYARAGLNDYRRTDDLTVLALADDRVAQAQADLLFCTRMALPEFTTNTGYCQGGNFTEADVTAAIAAQH